MSFSVPARSVTSRSARASSSLPPARPLPISAHASASVRFRSQTTISPPRSTPSSGAPVTLRARPARAVPGARRTFFSLPDISKLAGLGDAAVRGTMGGDPDEGDVQRYHARKILPYSQAQLYALVSDVPAYSSFIPFCTSSTVLAPTSPPVSASGSGSPARRRVQNDWKPTADPFDVEAELRVGFGGLEERYVSRVRGRPFESVVAEAAEEAALFKRLKTTWSFSPASTLSPHPSNPDPNSAPSPPTDPRLPNDTSAAADDAQRGPTLLTIDLAFEFANPLHRIASQAVLPKVADKMVQAFEERCLAVYGRGRE